MRRRPALLFMVLLLAVAAATADGKGKGFGTPPHKCGGGIYGGSGCYASDSGPNTMDDAGNGNIDISPHLVTVGQRLAMTAMGQVSPTWVDAPGLKALNCKPGQFTCIFKAVGRTSGWQRYSMGFAFGAIEEDYYGVTGKDGSDRIEGVVKKANRSPMRGVKVTISGPTRKTVTTDAAGSFRVKVKPGRYRISPAPRVCVQPVGLAGCQTSATVSVGPTASVTFQAPGKFKVSGTVMTTACEPCGTARAPREGAKVVAKPAGAGAQADATTRADGTYKLSLPTDTYDISVTEPAGGSPAHRSLALSADTNHVDFEVCPGATQSRQLGQCLFTVEVRLLDMAGKPVHNEWVFADTTDKGLFGLNTGSATERTDSTGLATFHLAENTWAIQASGHDLGSVQPGIDRAPDAGTGFPVRITRCDPGEVRPLPGVAADQPYPSLKGCYLKLVAGDGKGTRHVDIEADLWPVDVELTHSMPHATFVFSDPTPQPYQPVSFDNVEYTDLVDPYHRLWVEDVEHPRRHSSYLIPGSGNFKHQTMSVEVETGTSRFDQRVHPVSCTPGRRLQRQCLLALAKAQPHGTATFDPAFSGP